MLKETADWRTSLVNFTYLIASETISCNQKTPENLFKMSMRVLQLTMSFF